MEGKHNKVGREKMKRQGSVRRRNRKKVGKK